MPEGVALRSGEVQTDDMEVVEVEEEVEDCRSRRTRGREYSSIPQPRTEGRPPCQHRTPSVTTTFE